MKKKYRNPKLTEMAKYTQTKMWKILENIYKEKKIKKKKFKVRLKEERK